MLVSHRLRRIRVRRGCIIVLALIVFGMLAGRTFFEEQAMKRTILLMGRSFGEGLPPDPAFFTSDAVFRHGDLQAPYDVALSVFARHASERAVTGSIYTSGIQDVSGGIATISMKGLFTDGEASGVVVLRRTGLFTWKIAIVSSDLPAFGKLFFDVAPGM